METTAPITIKFAHC